MSRPVSAQVVAIDGGRPLRGTLSVRGAKNSISKQLVASLLTDKPAVLHNVPAIADTRNDVCGMARSRGLRHMLHGCVLRTCVVFSNPHQSGG